MLLNRHLILLADGSKVKTVRRYSVRVVALLILVIVGPADLKPRLRQAYRESSPDIRRHPHRSELSAVVGVNTHSDVRTASSGRLSPYQPPDLVGYWRMQFLHRNRCIAVHVVTRDISQPNHTPKCFVGTKGYRSGVIARYRSSPKGIEDDQIVTL